MPQLNTLVLKDGASTPVDHTFEPVDIVNGVANLAESGDVPIGNNRVSVSCTKTSTGRYKAIVKMVVPTVQTATTNGISVPTVVRTAYADLTFTFDSTSNSQERKDIVAFIRDALDPSKVMVRDAIVGLQAVY